jgi:DNA-directed RNA polymerase specialized sigma24 family protein
MGFLKLRKQMIYFRSAALILFCEKFCIFDIMTKASILTEIYQSKEVETIIRSIKPKDLQQDIKQHCFLELFEKPEEFILDLYNRGKLRHYIVKVLYNTSRWSCTTLHKQLGKEIPTEEFTDSECEIYEEVNIEPVLQKVYWYKTELVRLYAEHGTYQKVSDLTGIPLKSVYMTIIEARKEIKQKYYEIGKH